MCMYVCEGNEGNEKGGLDVIDIKFYLYFSLIPQKTSFAGLTEACYSAQKTYRLVLCKYLTLLRQAHTKDMVRERRERGEGGREGGRERERERKKERKRPLKSLLCTCLSCVCPCAYVFSSPCMGAVGQHERLCLLPFSFLFA